MLLLEAGPRDQGGSYYRSSPDLPHPDIQLYFSPLSYERPGRPRQRALMSPDAFSAFNASISPCKPKSAGHLELRSPDWRDPPAIHPNYLDDPHDPAQTLGGARFLRRLAASPALSAAIEAELKPGAAVQSDEALRADEPRRVLGFNAGISPCKSKSAGHLELRSPDWRDPPAIHPNYLDDPHDMAQMLGGPRFLRRLAASAALSAAIKVELKPGAAAQSDEALTADIRARAYSVFHPIGTCRMMGPDAATAAVDARLRVHGLDALRIASTSGNTNAPAIMVGDRAAGFILADARASR